MSNHDTCPFCKKNNDFEDCSWCRAAMCAECKDDQGRCPDCVREETQLARYREHIVAQAEAGDHGFFELVVDYGVHELEGIPDENGWTSYGSGVPMRCKHCGEAFGGGESEDDGLRNWEVEETVCPSRDERVTYEVPMAPFACWSLHRTHGHHLMPKWRTVCPSGMKMMLDDPYHTDFMVGSGMPFFDGHEDRNRKKTLRDAQITASGRMQRDLLGFEATVLSGGDGYAWGKVVHPGPGEDVPDGCIVVIPFAGPDYTIAALTAAKTKGAVITERGGPLSHLSIVGREVDLLLVRVRGAVKLYPEGTEVSVSGEDGTVDVSSGDRH